MSPEERAIYEWQTWVPDFGEPGQQRLKSASVLISRIGGVGGTAALYLAAAGVGRIVLAHAGDLKPSDLHRQILMSHAGVGTPRAEQARRRLLEINPHVQIEAVPENINERNASALVEKVDLICDCAPLFAERFLMNRQAVRQGKPMVECAMHELEGQVTTILPGKTPCLRCLWPEDPVWSRQFPVFGAVSGMIGCIAAMEAIKVLAGFGRPLAGRMLLCDLRDVAFRVVNLKRDPACSVCGKG
jgi:molybdopterin/thiamine biosynthesis adenylyltransferase